MAFLTADIPFFRCMVRREFTRDMRNGHGDYLDAVAFGVTAIEGRSLGFQVVFTGKEHGGAMWARMPIHGLVTKPCAPMPSHHTQPWDVPSRTLSVVEFGMIRNAACKVMIDSEWHPGRYLFTVDYTDSAMADDPEQHKQSHVIALESGHIVAQPNNRILIGDPAFWDMTTSRPDFIANTRTFSAEVDPSYLNMASADASGIFVGGSE